MRDCNVPVPGCIHSSCRRRDYRLRRFGRMQAMIATDLQWIAASPVA